MLHKNDKYIQHIQTADGGDFHDDSVVAQPGRKKTTKRKVGEKVDPKHMTPREFRKFSAGIWDGIEHYEGAYNFTAHKWDIQSVEEVDKRVEGRRKKNVKVSKEKRNLPRRLSDKEAKQIEARDNLVHILSILTFILIYMYLWSIAG